MMDDTVTMTPKEGRTRLLSAYIARDPGGFGEFAKRPFLNPIEQRDEKNKRKLHPLFVTGALLLPVAAAAAFFFFKH